ncbi:murein transglycosylase A [Thauera sinica]|uniref:peptidoglycan lytic exotransglycosylase n=1 Tax=Thauera sinica TaxID=2665146 RepID=A0ABW1AUL9_9RHOO|nr:murein transglycosylase A [Thauera sp. K11]ATE58563.1 murein transglycosylase [Thauera sp. K11]
MIHVLARRLAPGASSAFLLLLAGCAQQPVPPAPVTCAPQRTCPPCPGCPPPGKPAVAPAAPAEPAAGAPEATSWSTVEGWNDDDPAAALPALRNSCSVLSRQAAWKPVCDAAAALGPRPASAAARQFFEQHFVPWRLTNADRSAEGLVTGYYEPVIKGNRSRGGPYTWPIHGRPDDMLTIELGDVYPELKHLRLRGRLVGGKVLPYWSREELARRQDRLPAKVLLWASDPIDLFFLQVQGSGRVELPDGKTVRIGYADQNGHPYQSIGRWLVAQGELPLDKASMDGIKRWAQDNPARLPELLNANPSYVFFRELPASDDGPPGALGVPLNAGRSIAVDPRYVPLGAPVFLATTRPSSSTPLQRLMLAQDTGSAIKGAVRADFFWGPGPQAGAEAGRMRQQGKMWVLLPRGLNPPGPR